MIRGGRDCPNVEGDVSNNTSCNYRLSERDFYTQENMMYQKKYWILAIIPMSLLGLLATGSIGEPAVEKKRPTRYEYSFCYLLKIGEKSQVVIQNPDGSKTKAANWVELMEKIKAPGPKEGFPAIVNYLGSLGWRFVQTEVNDLDGESIRSYYFERIIRQ